MTEPDEKRNLTVTVDRRIFVAFLLVVAILTGNATWGNVVNRRESADLREDRRVFEVLKDELKDTKAIAQRADEQVRAVRDFQRCAFVLVLGLPLPQAKAEVVIQDCVKEANFPDGSAKTPPAPVVPKP